MSEPHPAGLPEIVIRNNHELSYSGPISFTTELPDGHYKGNGASAQVKSGIAGAVVELPAHSEARLIREDNARPTATFDGPFSVKSGPDCIRLLWSGEEVGRIEFGLVVVPGRDGDTSQIVSRFEPLSFTLTRKSIFRFNMKIQKLQCCRLSVSMSTFHPKQECWKSVVRKREY